MIARLIEAYLFSGKGLAIQPTAETAQNNGSGRLWKSRSGFGARAIRRRLCVVVIGTTGLPDGPPRDHGQRYDQYEDDGGHCFPAPPLFTTVRPQLSHVVVVDRDIASRQKPRAVSPQLVPCAGTIVVSESRG